jgi:translation initiation factor 2B subunit (eIF-2B alpha/beta/delta family)
MAQQSSIEQLIEEIKRRVQIIQSEPQTMARELMIDNLSVDLDNYVEIHKEEIIEAAADHCYPTYELAKIDAEDYYNKTFKSE